MDIGKIVREVEVLPEEEPDPIPLAQPGPDHDPEPAQPRT
jgi:hypothetical protein